MKWLDNDCLIYNNSTFIFTLDRQTLKSTQLTNFGANTTEDFCWDPSERYLIYVGYNREVCLHDLKSGTLLDRTLDDSDYSKGIIWLGDSDFSSIYGPASFATFGRNASLNVYEVFEERIRFIKRLENVCNKH
jgi:hypothetical protein